MTPSRQPEAQAQGVGAGGDGPPAYCIHRVIEPEAPKVLRFDRDYLLYVARGSVRLEADDRLWVVPPSRAAWIPAGSEIAVDFAHPLVCCSVLFRPGFACTGLDRCRVIELTSLAREMILYSRRWGPELSRFDSLAEAFFKALAGLCLELADQPLDVWIPRGRSPALKRALAFTEASLGEQVTVEDVARSAGLSQRTLARRFTAETGMTWRQAQRRMRMVRALELLSNGQAGIAAIAYEVGYESLSAFNRAFRDFSGLTPGEFRARHTLAKSL